VLIIYRVTIKEMIENEGKEMKQQAVFTGVLKYIRLGSKGNRHKLIIDDLKPSKEIQEIITKNAADRKLAQATGGKSPDKFSLHKELRNKPIAIYLLDRKPKEEQ